MTTSTPTYTAAPLIKTKDVIEVEQLSERYHSLLGGITWDQNTAGRMYRFSKELCDKRNYKKFTTFKSEGDDMITGNHLRLFSICEHHLLPFFGDVAIAYIPNNLIFGLSKLQRIVDKFASKPQIQERLTSDIANFINYLIKPKGVAVQVKAIHTCVFARGTQSTNAEFTTTKVLGLFKEDRQAHDEFLKTIQSQRMQL